MALYAQIGRVSSPPGSAAERLLSAAAQQGRTGNGVTVPVQPNVVPAAPPGVRPNRARIGQADSKTTVTIDGKTLLLVGGGLGALYMLTHRGGARVTGGRNSWVFPALVLGGLGLWWYMSKKAAPPTATALPGTTALPGGAAPAVAPATVDNPERDWLLNSFQATNPGNEQAMLRAIPLMTDAELHWLYIRAKSQIPGNNLEYAAYMANRATVDAVMAKYQIPGL